MASHSQQSPPPPAPTTVRDLGNDLLREIFLRLPSLPSLVRAALSLRTFLHAVRSSPAFRRSFSAARPPPLLGLFVDADGPAIPTFVSVRSRSDPDLAAVVRGADFFLTRVPDGDDNYPWWVIADCRDGYVLLHQNFNVDEEQFALYNPITQALDLIPFAPDELADDEHFASFILSSQESAQPLRLVCTFRDESRARAAVFSSDTREWHIFPWSEPVTPQPEDKDWLKLKTGTMVKGFYYWIATNHAYMLVLNTATLEFSQMDLPPSLEGQDYLFRVGEDKDGKLCLVCLAEVDLYVWFWRADDDDDGIERWMLDKRFQLQTGDGELRIVAIISGFVYFSTNKTTEDDALYPCCWFLSFCMETEETDLIFQKRFDSYICPYIMPWPSCLIENMVHPQLEGA